jgi:esterase/lipase superfamily enzyme
MALGMRRILLFCLVLASCAPRAQVDVAQPVPGAVLETVHVVTSRAPVPNEIAPGTRRAATLTQGRYVVAIPPERESGDIPRPRRNQPADPRRHFTLAEGTVLSAVEFQGSLRRALAAEQAAQREAVIFVHGFNTHFIEGLYRVAQLGYDLQLPGVLMHYAWPSLGAPLAYAHDRDSALIARDGLQEMIRQTAAAGAPRIVLIAHSMGAHLLMETLRQMALDGSLARARLGGVILIAPDIDVDLFRSQAQRIGRLPQPFLIVTSQRDRVLWLSARLTGQPDRLGNLTDGERVAGLGVTVVDVSAFGAGDGHFTVADSPALIQLLGRIGAVDAALAGDAAGSLPLIPGTILTLQTTTEALLSPLSGGPLRPLSLHFGPSRRVVRPVEIVAE